METLAIVLVLSSSVMHATWNMLARRSVDPYAFFVCLNVATIIIWLPIALPLYLAEDIAALSYALMLLSGSLQVAYFAFLGAAYRRGGLALVYPIARGTGVAVVPVAAMLIFDERPSTLATAGIAIVLFGLSLTGIQGYLSHRHATQDNANRAAVFALMTGLTIACYSLVDKQGVQDINPIVYGYGLIAVAVVLQIPFILLRKRREVSTEWRRSRFPIVVGGVLSLGTYVLVLFALQSTNVGIVVPLRETSIVFGFVLGVVVLRERLARPQVAAGITIGLGALAIAIGG